MTTDATLDRFPVRSELKDGSPFTTRPLEKGDENQFRDLHTVIPEREQLFIRSEIRDGSLFRKWLEDPEFEQFLPLGAFVEGRLGAIGVLELRMGGWKRHIGKVYVLTHPDFRGQGMIQQLIAEIVTSASDWGLRFLESELNGERTSAIEALGVAGFEELLRVENYIQDMQAEYHDYVLMSMRLQPSLEYISAGD